MSPMEIFLLICGGIIFILSFVIPVSREEASEETKEMVQNEIRKLVSEEMDRVKSQVNDSVDEAVEYAMEKTERSLERLSNEKIMAVSDYSDTVIQEIHKNHEEVMFLYDMLNDKHTNLKHTVSKVNQTVKAAEETAREAEAAVSSFKELVPEKAEDARVIPSVKEEEPLPEPDGAEEKPNRNEEILRLHDSGKSEVEIAKQLGMGVGEVKLVIGLFRNA